MLLDVPMCDVLIYSSLIKRKLALVSLLRGGTLWQICPNYYRLGCMIIMHRVSCVHLLNLNFEDRITKQTFLQI